MRSHRAGTRSAAGILVLAGALAGCQTYEASELDARAHRRAWRDRTPTAPEVLDAARLALVDGWQLSMWFGVGVAALTLVYLVVRGPRTVDLDTEDALDADLPELVHHH